MDVNTETAHVEFRNGTWVGRAYSGKKAARDCVPRGLLNLPRPLADRGLEQVDEEVGRQRPRPLGDDAVRGLARIRAQGSPATDEYRISGAVSVSNCARTTNSSSADGVLYSRICKVARSPSPALLYGMHRSRFLLEYWAIVRPLLREAGKVSPKATDGVWKAGSRRRPVRCDVRAILPASKGRAIPHPALRASFPSKLGKEGAHHSRCVHAGEGGAKRRMGCGPLLRRRVGLHERRREPFIDAVPVFRTPVGAHLPRFAEGEFMSRATPHECAR